MEPYAMLNYKMSLSILCKWAESEYKLTPKEINPTKYKSNNTEFIKLDHPTPFYFSVYKNVKNLRENMIGQVAFVPLEQEASWKLYEIAQNAALASQEKVTTRW